MKKFNTTGTCVPERHYMVDITERLAEIKVMVDEGDYFCINKGRQYGKTTTLVALAKYLKDEYLVLNLSFQAISDAGFRTEEAFVGAFSRLLIRKGRRLEIPEDVRHDLDDYASRKEYGASLDELFSTLSLWCELSEKPIVMFIDEADSASNNRVFLDFLAQLRNGYLERLGDEGFSGFQSVILAGVTDIKNLRRKIRGDEEHKLNSPWNIAADFKINMSLEVDGIAKMLSEYERDHATGMNVKAIAGGIYDYTEGYPFLVSRLCQVMDEDLVNDGRFVSLSEAWSEEGLNEAVRRVVFEENTLFDSLIGKVINNEGLAKLLERGLFSGEPMSYDAYNLPVMDAKEYGFVEVHGMEMKIANRMFEMRLYNYFLGGERLKETELYGKVSYERPMFIKPDGRLDMDKVLERFVVTFDEIYEGKSKPFLEEDGRRLFLLYVRPIINGTGNYYVEARTRDMRRMDVVIDYLGERFVVELKIWRGNAYNERGEKQLSDYLDYYHLKKGYMVSYNFNEKKRQGVFHVKLGDKELVEAVI